MFDVKAYQQYAAWIFDLDGTLSNALQAHDLAWQHALTQFAIPFTSERMQQLGGADPDTVEILAHEAGMQVDVSTVVTVRDRRFYELLPTTLSPTPLVAGVGLPFLGENRWPSAPAVITRYGASHSGRFVFGSLPLPIVVGADQVVNPETSR